MKRISLYTAFAVLTAVTATSWGAKICVDPGHGGSDSGAVGGTQYEKTNVLNTGLKFRDWLNADSGDGAGGGSWSVVMTRTSDVSVSLQGRCDISNNNGCNRFMSIHNNACGACGASGTETFSYSSTGTAADLRNKVNQRGVEAWGLNNRGNKTAGFYVLVNTAAPAELAELGFVDSSYDRNFVGVSTQQDKVARYHLYALQNHYGITAYTPGSSSASTYVDDSPSHAGTWAVSASAADKYGADYLYRSTAAVSDPASWAITVSTGGNYDISAWWSAGTNRAPSAPYILPDNSTVNVNQQINGGRWNLLGTRAISGTATTKLSCWTTSGYVVIADAIRYYGPK